VASASQGAVAAVIGAGLGAVAEPVVNTVLVERVTVPQALEVFDWDKACSFFWNATLPTNLIKFPMYEIINMLLSQVSIPKTGQGAITGAVFTTLTLPLGNYRFCKSMGLPIDLASLYKAYLPTLIRDVIYGVARSTITALLAKKFPGASRTAWGQFATMFVTALAACIISSPGNELRGYCLQPPSKKQSFGNFFQPAKYVRSTSVGATNLALSLGAGSLVVEPMKVVLPQIRAYVKGNPSAVMLILFVLHQWLEARRHRHLTEKLESIAAATTASVRSHNPLDASFEKLYAEARTSEMK